MSDSVDPVLAGNQLECLLAVTNNGPGDAQAVTVTTLLPSEISFDSTSGCGTDPGGIPECILGEFPAGKMSEFQVAVVVDGGGKTSEHGHGHS